MRRGTSTQRVWDIFYTAGHFTMSYAWVHQWWNIILFLCTTDQHQHGCVKKVHIWNKLGHTEVTCNNVKGELVSFVSWLVFRTQLKKVWFMGLWWVPKETSVMQLLHACCVVFLITYFQSHMLDSFHDKLRLSQDERWSLKGHKLWKL